MSMERHLQDIKICIQDDGELTLFSLPILFINKLIVFLCILYNIEMKNQNIILFMMCLRKERVWLKEGALNRGSTYLKKMCALRWTLNQKNMVFMIYEIIVKYLCHRLKVFYRVHVLIMFNLLNLGNKIS